MVLFYSHKFSNMGIQGKCVSFCSYGSFCSYKFSNMGIQGDESSFFA